MTQKDLDKLNSFKERFDKFPKTADLKLKVYFGEPTEQEREAFKKLSEEVNDLFYDIQVFCKVKFKDDNHYLNTCQNISLDTHIMGIPVATTYQEQHKESWSNGMKKLGALIQNMIREVELRVEDESSKEIEESTKKPTPKSNTAQKILAFCAIVTLIILLIRQCGFNDQKIIVKDEGLQEKVDKQTDEIKELKSVTNKLLELIEIKPTNQIKKIEKQDIVSEIEDSVLKTKIELSENTPIGVYKLDPSFTEAFSLIINNSISKGISPNDVFVEITGTADMMKITNLSYKGEFGKINEAYKLENDSLAYIKLDNGRPIYNNSDLAFLRAFSLKKQLEETAKLNPENIKINIRKSDEIGREFRNTTVKLRIKGNVY